MAGFIGSHLAERLLGEGTAVRGVDRLSAYYDASLKRANLELIERSDGFELIEGDINALNPGELLEGIDVVYHLAGQPGVRVSWGTEFQIYLDDNVLSTQRLLEAARNSRLEKFVLASSSSIYGDAESFPTVEDAMPAPVSPYGVSKLAAEHLCRLYAGAFDVPALSLRYFTIFGPRQRPDMAFQRFITASLDDRPIEVFGDGLQERDFTYVGDAVRATIAAGSEGRPGAAYNIAGGNHATVLDVIEALSRLRGGDPLVTHLPAVTGDARKTGASIELASRDLGYAPAVTLQDGLANQLEAEMASRSSVDG